VAQRAVECELAQEDDARERPGRELPAGAQQADRDREAGRDNGP
jgi:hypothetical protein